VSRSGGDLSNIGRVTEPVGNGVCGEVVTPRCTSRLSIGRLRNTNRLNRVYGLKCHLHLHDLSGGLQTRAGYRYGLALKCLLHI